MAPRAEAAALSLLGEADEPAVMAVLHEHSDPVLALLRAERFLGEHATHHDTLMLADAPEVRRRPAPSPRSRDSENLSPCRTTN